MTEKAARFKQPGFCRRSGAVASSELHSFWGGAAAGIALLVFLGLLGFFFYNNVAGYVLSSLNAAAKGASIDAGLALFSQGLTQTPLIMMLVAPLVTMRTLASFRRGGTLDFFLTLPISLNQLIYGQFLAAWISLSFMSLLSLAPFMVLVLTGVGQWPVIMITALGYVSLAALFAGVGLMCSAAFSSPVGAGLGTLGVLGLMWVLGWASPYADKGMADFLQGLAFAPRITRMATGLLNLNDLFFFFALTMLALIGTRLFLSARATSGAD